MSKELLEMYQNHLDKLHSKMDCVYKALNELFFMDIPYEHKQKVLEVAQNLLKQLDEINKGGNND